MKSLVKKLQKMSLQSFSGDQARNSSILIEISDPQIHGIGNKKYVDYLVTTKTTLQMFNVKEFSVRRRFSDFEHLKLKIEQILKVKRILCHTELIIKLKIYHNLLDKNSGVAR